MSNNQERSGAEVDGGGRRRPRHWSDAEKRRIVAESYEPGVTVKAVARRNDVGANQVFDWRRNFREQDGDAGHGAFVPVVVAPAGEAPSDDAVSGNASEGRIEIALGSGLRVFVDGTVNAPALARVLACC